MSIIQYEEYQEGDIVFRYGDDGDKFYLIMKGEITVFTPNMEIPNWEKQYEILRKIKEEKVEAKKMDHKKHLVD